VFEPNRSREEAGRHLAEWKRAVERSRDWARD
jgi:glycerol kinase